MDDYNLKFALDELTLVSNAGDETTISFEKLLANEQNVILNSEDGIVTPPIASNIKETEIIKTILYDVFPNPTQGNINIVYDIAESNSDVKLSVITADGRLLDVLFEGKLDVGQYNTTSVKLAGFKGVAIIKLQVNDTMFIKKVVVN